MDTVAIPPPLFAELTLACGGQGDIGAVIGVSRRTISRWGGRATLFPSQIQALLRELVPGRAALARRLSEATGVTFESAGVHVLDDDERRRREEARTRGDAESVLCASAEALDVSPRAARPGVLAAFRRAQELGLDVAAVIAGLAPPPAPPPAPQARRRRQPSGGQPT